MSNHYHCYIGEIKPSSDKRFTGPFKSVEEVVTMTGMPYETWLKLYQECDQLKPIKEAASDANAARQLSKKQRVFVEF